MRGVSGRFKPTYLVQPLHGGSPGKSSARTQYIRRGVQRSNNDEMARCGSTAKGCGQRLKRSHVSERKRGKRA